MAQFSLVLGLNIKSMLTRKSLDKYQQIKLISIKKY